MQIELSKVLEELNTLETNIDKSSLVMQVPTPQKMELAPPQANEAAELIVVSEPRRYCKELHRERRAAKKRSQKANQSPEEKVAAVEAFLTNITN